MPRVKRTEEAKGRIQGVYFIDQGGHLFKSEGVDLLKGLLAPPIKATSTLNQESSRSFEYGNAGGPLEDGEIGPDEEMELITYDPPYDPDNLAKLLELDTTHYRACRTKATDIAGLDIRIVHKDNIATPPPEDEKKLIDDFLARAARGGNLQDLIEEFEMDYESIGWGAWEVIRTREGKIDHLQHVPAKDVRVLKETRCGGPKYAQLINETDYVLFQEFPQKFGEKKLFLDPKHGTPTDNFAESANELIYHRYPHPATRYYGLPDIIPAMGDILVTNEIRDYFISFFENQCMARWAIVVKGGEIDADTEAAIKTYFQSEVKDNPHRTIMLNVDEDTEVIFKRLDADQKEADFRETRKDLRDFILFAHGVPPAQVGIVEQANLGSGNGLSQAETYLNRIVLPRQRRWHGVLDQIVINGLGCKTARIRLTPPDIRDLDIITRAHERMLKTAVLSPNESRQIIFGLSRFEGGDEHVVSSRSTTPRSLNDAQAVGSLNKSENGSSSEEVSDAS